MQQLLEIQPSSKTGTQVHSIETTVDKQLPESYQLYRQRSHALEIEPTLNLYCTVDASEGTTRAEKFLECRQWAYFSRHQETGQVRVISNACHLRWCPVCSAARYNHIRTEVSKWLLSVRRPKFLTLTMRHQRTPLENQVKALYRHFRNFRMNKLCKRKIRGGVWFFQLKKSGKNAQWHPHLHCILDADYIDKFDLSREWERTTGNSFIVDIRAIDNPRKVVEYVARYSAKPCKLSDFTPEDRIQVFTVFHGRRLCGTFGTGRSISLRPKPTEDRFKWIRLPSWAFVVSNRNTIPACRAIFKAYLLNQPLDEKYANELCMPHDTPVKTHFGNKTVIEDHQMIMEGFT